MSYAEAAGSDAEVDLTVSLKSVGGMSIRGEDNTGSARGRTGTSARNTQMDNTKHQNDGYNWKEQVHTLVKSDSESELSDSEHFLTKGAFLLTPSHDLSIEKASTICEKMNFKGCFSLTKTATGILFKFSDFDDYQCVFKKGFHKVTNSRFYRKVIIPCRPQKTFTVYVFDIPEDLPEEDIRHSLYKFTSIVEVVRMHLTTTNTTNRETAANASATAAAPAKTPMTATDKPQRRTSLPTTDGESGLNTTTQTLVVRITLASIEECNILLQNGLDFYGATYFPTELAMPQQGARLARANKVTGGSISARLRELLPVFDNAGFVKLPPPTMKMIKPKAK